MRPSAFTNAPYRACPGPMVETSFVNRRWTSRPASGPVTSYLDVEYRSHRPVAVRIASYSASGSVPTLIAHGQPSSQIISAPAAICASCRGERRSSTVIGCLLFPGPRLLAASQHLAGSAACLPFLGVVDREHVDRRADRAAPQRDIHGRALSGHVGPKDGDAEVAEPRADRR